MIPIIPALPLPGEVLANIVEGLSTQGWAVTDNFLTELQVSGLLSHIHQLKATDDLQKAGIGKQLKYQKNKAVRGDYICWIEQDEAEGDTRQVINSLQEIMLTLNRTCFLGLKDFEMHYAVYPEGSFYKRHVDRFQHNPHRVVSFVCYLNTGWQPGHGGELVIYPEGEEPTLVQPLAGRMICFQSSLEHEVLPTAKDRYSITGWMLDQLSDLTFL